MASLIYDCFIFNNELDLLELRLAYLYDIVNFFVLVESELTLSGNHKPLYYNENKERFEKYSSKIIHIICPPQNFNTAWEYEYYQRNFIKTALLSCDDGDIVLISDVDEILNVNDIIKHNTTISCHLVELPMFYYFYNLKSDITFSVNLLSRYKYLKNEDIGDRFKYDRFTHSTITCIDKKIGWHFSYLFGDNIDLYINKLKSFSHQEYNTPYFLNKERIKRCIMLGIDLFDRGWYNFNIVNESSEFDQKLLYNLYKLNFNKKYKLNYSTKLQYIFNHKNFFPSLKFYLKKIKFLVNIKRSLFK
jgi:beta-1,4-mannosyl-glycoprotein beta-1,4-N-acetylglucosaminyltransferase